MLSPSAEVVPFIDSIRSRELHELEAWTESDARISFRLFYAHGGFGKTRLFQEYARRLRAKGWHAGFLLMDADLSAILSRVARSQRPAFAVLDYAETWSQLSDRIRELLRYTDEFGISRIRVALLSRNSGEWWGSLCNRGGEQIRSALLSHLPFRVAPTSLSIDDRRHAFDVAHSAFGKLLGSSAPVPKNYSLDDAVFERILYVHIAALASHLGVSVGASELLDALLSVEIGLWCHALPKLPEWTLDSFPRLAQRLVAAVTMRGGVTLERAKELRDQLARQIPEDFVYFLSRIMPTVDLAQSELAAVGPLEPDLLGERLVQRALEESPATLFGPCLESDSDEQLRNVFRTVGRIARTNVSWHFKREHFDIGHWLDHVLFRNSDRRILAAFDAALSLAESPIKTSDIIPLALQSPLADALVRAVPTISNRETLASIVRRLPEQSTSLIDLGVAATSHQLEHIEQLPVEEQARLLDTVAVRLASLEQPTAALKYSERAVSIARSQAQTSADDIHWDLAGFLCNLGSRYNDSGRANEAIRALNEGIQMYRLALHTQSNRLSPELAMALSNLGCIFGDQGRYEKALEVTGEAVHIRRELSKQAPTLFLPHLAAALDNLGIYLSGLGLLEEALVANGEGIAIRSTLADDRPDAYLSDLANSLHNGSNILFKLGKHTDSLELMGDVVSIREQLYFANPVAHSWKYLSNLVGMSEKLSESGKHADAISLLKKAELVIGHTAYGDDSPEGIKFHTLGRINQHLGECYARAGIPDEALRYARNAVDMARRVPFPLDASDGHPLPYALHNLGDRLITFERYDEALLVLSEAVDIARRAAESNPDGCLPVLAISLHNQSGALYALLRADDAVKTAEEAVNIRRTLSRSKPALYLPLFANSLGQLGNALTLAGRPHDSLRASKEALDIARQLATERRSIHLRLLARSLANYGLRLSAVAEYVEACRVSEEAVTAMRELSHVDAGTAAIALPKSLLSLGSIKWELGMHSEAVNAIGEAVELLSPLTEKWPNAYGTLFRVCMEQYCYHFARLDARSEEQIRILEVSAAAVLAINDTGSAAWTVIRQSAESILAHREQHT